MHGENNLAAEMCTLFSVAAQIPLKYVVGRSYTSEFALIKKLFRYLKKGDLLLLDNGFYSFNVFQSLNSRCCHFIIPASVALRPKVLQRLGTDDFLAEIKDSKSGETMTVRVVYAYRKGFRRRRLVTSLLAPEQYPAVDICQLYHWRWSIETFFRDFKSGMESINWHCKTVHSFNLELCSHMLTATLVRMVMCESGKKRGRRTWEVSFSKALIEVRLFFNRILRRGTGTLAQLLADTVEMCSRFLVDIRPGRSFPREKHKYRSKARGIDKKRGRPTKPAKPIDERGKECILSFRDEDYLLN